MFVNCNNEENVTFGYEYELCGLKLQWNGSFKTYQ